MAVFSLEQKLELEDNGLIRVGLECEGAWEEPDKIIIEGS